MKFLMSSLILTSFLLNTSYAEDSSGKKRRPPREAVEACQSSDVGASCSFSGRDGESVSGTCAQKDSSRPPVCKPSNMNR